MIRTLFIYLLAVFLAAGCCGKDNSALADYVARQDRMCPMPADDLMIISRVVYNEDEATVELWYSVNDFEHIDVAEMKRAKPQLRTAIASRLQSDDSDEFLQMLADGGAALRLDFSGILTGDVFGITFTPEQIRELAHRATRQNRDFLSCPSHA